MLCFPLIPKRSNTYNYKESRSIVKPLEENEPTAAAAAVTTTTLLLLLLCNEKRKCVRSAVGTGFDIARARLPQIFLSNLPLSAQPIPNCEALYTISQQNSTIDCYMDRLTEVDKEKEISCASDSGSMPPLLDGKKLFILLKWHFWPKKNNNAPSHTLCTN